MSKTLSNARNALVKALMDGNFFNTDHVAFENVKFDPPTKGPWAAIYFMPNQPTVATLGAGGEDEATGFLQVDLNYPPNSGEKDARVKFEAIRNLFAVGTRPAFDGQEVIIESCGCSAGRIKNTFYCISVTIAFRVYLER